MMGEGETGVGSSEVTTICSQTRENHVLGYSERVVGGAIARAASEPWSWEMRGCI